MIPRSASQYTIVKSTDTELVLVDVGPWSLYPTITNDIENVVRELYERGQLRNGMLLFYHDSDNELTRVEHQDGLFIAFKEPPMAAPFEVP